MIKTIVQRLLLVATTLLFGLIPPCSARCDDLLMPNFSIGQIANPGENTDRYQLVKSDSSDSPAEIWVGKTVLLDKTAFSSASFSEVAGMSDQALADLKRLRPDWPMTAEYEATLRQAKGRVEVHPTETGANDLYRITQANIGRNLAIVLNNRVIATPRVAEAVRSLSIGELSKKRAESLALEINDVLGKKR